MAIAKRCFICAHKENIDKTCTNPDCPRYSESKKVDKKTDSTNH